MELHALVAPVFETNCLVLLNRSEAVVLDPGGGAAPLVAESLNTAHARVSGVVATHGHPDHVWDTAAVAGGAMVYISSRDAHRMADPAAALGPGLGPMFPAMAGGPWRAPDNVAMVPATRFDAGGGIELQPLPAPGHTEGSTVFLLPGPVTLASGSLQEAAGAAEAELVVFSGDVLFAGSIGRTDLPGGDEQTMATTLGMLMREIPPEALLIPGHGPATTMARERATNPFLTDLQ